MNVVGFLAGVVWGMLLLDWLTSRGWTKFTYRSEEDAEPLPRWVLVSAFTVFGVIGLTWHAL
jgi:hypothetical protein